MSAIQAVTHPDARQLPVKIILRDFARAAAFTVKSSALFLTGTFTAVASMPMIVDFARETSRQAQDSYLNLAIDIADRLPADAMLNVVQHTATAMGALAASTAFILPQHVAVKLLSSKNQGAVLKRSWRLGVMAGMAIYTMGLYSNIDAISPWRMPPSLPDSGSEVLPAPRFGPLLQHGDGREYKVFSVVPSAPNSLRMA